MGNREALMAGAKRCLLAKGYGRTTARDIATEAGVSLAAIGYHFRTTEALLNAAMIEAIGDWGREFGKALAAGGADLDQPLDRFAALWDAVRGSIGPRRQLLLATFEATGQLDRVPEVREHLAEGLNEGRHGLAELFQGLTQGTEEARLAGSVYQAMMTGLLVQWLVDPDRAPTGAEVAEGLRLIGRALTTD